MKILGKELTFNGNKVYHAGNKPTASEIGAAASNHTHNYAGSSSAGGNANAAVKLATARTINGTSFDGTGNITTANWGTARNIQIGNAVKSVNGSGNVTWNWSEMQVPRAYSSSYSFGGNQNAITTAQFITMLTNLGAFSQPYWIARGSWSYASNQYINDTGCGNIHLAGCTVEVMGTSSAYTIRITTPTTSSSGVTNGDFIYVNNGGSYSPGWRRLYSTAYKPTPSDIGAAASNHTHSYLPLSGGTMTGAITVSGESRFHNGTYTDPWNGTSCAIKASGHVAVNGQIKATSTVTAPTFAGALSGNATTASSLASARLIGKASFNGSANITLDAIAGRATIPSSADTHKNKYSKFARIDVSGGTYRCCSGTLHFVPSEGLTFFGELRYYFRTGSAISSISIDLRWKNLSNTSYANKVFAVKVSDGVYDLYYQPLLDWDTMTVTNVNSVGASYITLTSNQAYVASITAAVTSSLSSHISNATTANTATTLQTARTINGTSFNGSANITTANWGTARTLTVGKTAKSVNGSANVSWNLSEIGAMGATNANGYWGLTAPDGNTSNWIRTTTSGIIPYQSGGASALGTSSWPFSNAYINTVYGNLSGNASTATKLQTARTINGTSFDGSANITTANWGTARNIQIGNTAKSVNGSANVSWSLSEIGAAPAGYGLGTTCQDKSNQDCNNILVTGFYMGSNMTNKPSGCTHGWIYLLVMRHNDSWVRQVAYDFGTASQVYTRVKQNNSWTSWVATDNNTWRGVQDNLTSTATDQSLSANQGKVLKGLIDGKAASNHTHGLVNLNSQAFGGGNDLNTYNSNKTWIARTYNTTTNRPGDWCTVANFGADGNSNFQLAHSYASDSTLYVRGRHDNSGNYTPWAKIYTDKNKPTASEIGAAPASHSHSYLPLSGGTVNGNLTVQGIIYGKNNIALDRGTLWVQGAGGNTTCDYLRFGTNILASNDSKQVYLMDTAGNRAHLDMGDLNAFSIKLTNGAYPSLKFSNNVRIEYDVAGDSLYVAGTKAQSGGLRDFKATQCHSTVNAVIAGKKLFIQSGTPSGVATGDVWIQI